VAVRRAPRLNAAGRMASADDVIQLFLTDDPERARKLAAQLHELNQQRQQAESEIVRSVLAECTRAPVTDEQSALVFCGQGWHRGVVGIVASRLVERFHRPVFVLSDDPELGLAQGSGRSVPGFHLLEALESMPELFTKFGGHKQAAGVTLSSRQVEAFHERFNRYAATRLSPSDFCPVYEIDAVARLEELHDEAVAEVLSLAPFGCGNPAPLLAVQGVEVCGDPVPMKEKHLRVRVRQGDSPPVWVKGWNFAERAGELRNGNRVDIAVCLEEDTYSASRGYAPWSATLKDIRLA
jgi:single-stranded-DNA-specific exonuclease